ncbi:MAG: hypothetical protein LBH47_03115 [Christensenellaceae bacterium]|nr:hypothetical protein [Christensenellaceae bacterium]
MKERKRIFSNKTIVLIKLVSACILFFGCCLFFFQYFDYFKEDFENFDENILFEFVFFAGLIFIIYYITNMVSKFDDDMLWKADRLYTVYQLAFVAVLLSVLFRCFFVNMTAPNFIAYIMMFSGVVTLLTPQIIDNDNEDF